MRADVEHGHSTHRRGPHGPIADGLGAMMPGTEGWIFQAVGSDREVLLVGPDSARLGDGLARQRCEVTAIGGDLDAVGFLDPLGDRRFDAVVISELLDHSREPISLLGQIRRALHPGGFVVATRSEPSAEAEARGRGVFLSLFQRAGFAVSRYQPMTLPSAVASLPDPGPWIERTMIVALPVAEPDREIRPPADQALAEDRDAAFRVAADATRDLKSARALVASLSDRLAQASRRERELCRLLQQAHEQIERGEEEFRSIAHGLLEEVRCHAEARTVLEGRHDRLRRSLPGRLYLLIRAVVSLGRRHPEG